MKTKLLKKVRKRFSIEYYPNGRYIYGIFSETPMVCLIDKEDSNNFDYFTVGIYTKEEVYNILIEKLINIIRKEYSKYGTRRNKIKREKTDNGIKLWWK